MNKNKSLWILMDFEDILLSNAITLPENVGCHDHVTITKKVLWLQNLKKASEDNDFNRLKLEDIIRIWKKPK